MSPESQHAIKEYTLSFNHLGIEVTHIEKAMGNYENGSPAPFPELIRENLLKVSEDMEIKGGYRIFDSVLIERDRSILNVCDISFEIGKIIEKQLQGSESIAVFACTAGEDITGKSKKLMENGDMIQAYIMDTIGSVAVESAMDFIQEKLAATEMAHHRKMTNRFSPGYCGWNISAQRALFSLLPKNFCGITLTDSFLMKPIKSVSGVIGLGVDAKRLEYPCQACDKKDCFRRWRG